MISVALYKCTGCEKLIVTDELILDKGKVYVQAYCPSCEQHDPTHTLIVKEVEEVPK